MNDDHAEREAPAHSTRRDAMSFEGTEDEAFVEEVYLDRFAELLWVDLICQCDICDVVLELDELEHLLDRDRWRWGQLARDRAIEAGWRWHGHGKILCRQCALDYGKGLV
ncbi:MAG TPA: hypothetical protein VHC19_03705 [Pirellulales bacterium]|nr:hypothetical protein [Pirellulales bacterium]